MKLKDILLSLGTLGTTVAPIATVIACGNQSPEDEETTKETLSSVITDMGSLSVELSSGTVLEDDATTKELVISKVKELSAYTDLSESKKTLINVLLVESNTTINVTNSKAIFTSNESTLEVTITIALEPAQTNQGGGATSNSGGASQQPPQANQGGGATSNPGGTPASSSNKFNASFTSAQINDAQTPAGSDNAYTLTYEAGTDSASADDVKDAFIGMLSKDSNDQSATAPSFAGTWNPAVNFSKNGTYTLTVSATNYEDVTLEVTVKGN